MTTAPSHMRPDWTAMTAPSYSAFPREYGLAIRTSKACHGPYAFFCPDVVQLYAPVTLNAFEVLLFCRHHGVPLFTAFHQSPSAVKPPLLSPKWSPLKFHFKIGPAFPSAVIAKHTVRCFAATRDCAIIATSLYSVPPRKICINGLGYDPDVMYPVRSQTDLAERTHLRSELGFTERDIGCIYTGRLVLNKRPSLLAPAVERLPSQGKPYSALFIGTGPEAQRLANTSHCRVLNWQPYSRLGAYYRAADIAVWPFLESISMLDSAACGLPLVLPHRMANRESAHGNSVTIDPHSVESLATALLRLKCPETRKTLGLRRARNMSSAYTWDHVARDRLNYYLSATTERNQI